MADDAGTLERNRELLAHRAPRAVGADEIVAPDGQPVTLGRDDLGGDAVAVLRAGDEPGSEAHVGAERLGAPAEHGLERIL